MPKSPKKTSPKNAVKNKHYVETDRRNKILKYTDEILCSRQNGIVLVTGVTSKDENGMATDTLAKVHNIPRKAMLKILVEAFNLEADDFAFMVFSSLSK